jgi:pimeloyl-ACP methyl ester carboxylesterase
MPRSPFDSLVSINGIDIAVWDWPGEEPAVFFCHATGFHGRIWDQVVAHFPERHCIAFDARGHGRSSKPAPPYSWRTFGADVAALAEFLELAGAIGVGHSLGGHSVTLGAALRPSAFSALVLFDPVIRAKDEYGRLWDRTSFVRKRRNHWTSREEMFERFENRSPFDSWDRQILKDYIEYGLVPAGGGFVLACPPEVEAPIYESSTAAASNIYPEIATVAIPVHVVRAGRCEDPSDVMKTSLTTPDLAVNFARGRDTLLLEHSHLFPMEAPQLAADLIANAISLL